MYISFFNLRYKPFQITPDPEFLFMSRVHKKALTYLNYGISSDSGGFILVTGEVGTGKTTTIRSIMKEQKKDVIFSRVNNTRLTSDQLISMINDDFNLDIQGRNKTQMLRDLTDFLIEQYRNGKRSILIIDEAQNLTPDLLEEIRLLSNLETSKSKLLQIILVGQPELRKVLALPELRSLRQRINVSCHISPLTMVETEEYIFHRLEVAGNREAVSFHSGGIELIYNFARGIPRLINIVCDFLLLSAFIDRTREISLDMAKEVINDLEKENRYWQDGISEEYSDSVNCNKEMKEKAENLEERHLERKDIDYFEKMEIFEKISETERQLTSAIDQLKVELTKRDAVNTDARFNNVVKEVNELKGIASEFKKGGGGPVKGEKEKKRNLWSKIFN
jgi:putative secretion ATPase (PEP-CTERM system associated)